MRKKLTSRLKGSWITRNILESGNTTEKGKMFLNQLNKSMNCVRLLPNINSDTHSNSMHAKEMKI